jgi:hypothetical protein
MFLVDASGNVKRSAYALNFHKAATSAGFGRLWPTHEWGFALATSPPSLKQASTVLSGSATHPPYMHVQDMVGRASADAEQLRGELERMKGSLTREQAMRAEAERQVRCGAAVLAAGPPTNQLELLLCTCCFWDQ